VTFSGFKACRIYRDRGVIENRMEQLTLEDLSPGEVVIKNCYSSINYKDALAVTGRGKIIRNYPLIPGIDLVGVVESSEDNRFVSGDEVLVNGCGMGEKHNGGFAQYARIPADWIIPLPKGLSPLESMVLGTAGLTAALCLHRMENNGQSPEQGPVVVTGASGGVGSIAISMLTGLGYEVIAVSGRESQFDYLSLLGAAQVVKSETLELTAQSLQNARFAGIIDNVGGELLASLLASVLPWGNVASVGMAADPKFSATVFPFILRGVSLLGVSSSNCPMPVRRRLWDRLSKDLKPEHLDKIISDIVSLDDLNSVCSELLDRERHGRIVVDCRS